MNEIMLSVRPKWCEKICSGEKTIEVRKTLPKLQMPFKCYIYCTQASVKYRTICGCHVPNSDELYRHPEQGIKHGDSIELMLCEYYTKDNFLNGKVIGEFVCKNITCIKADIDISGDKHLYNTAFFGGKTCLSDEELFDYIYSAPNKTGWGWWLFDLKIYDKPKQLSDFYIDDKEAITGCRHRFRWGQPESVTQNGGWIKGSYCCMKSGEPEWCEKCLKKPLVKPPQSWCYVERRD